MNQEKIGKFIAQCRRKKHMTQQELSEKLGVSDRTIGNWENGRNMPDLSLFKPLCKELGITINELLSGEKIDKKDYQEKLEENILNTIDYTDKRIKKNNKLFKIIICTTIVVIVSLILMFFVDVRMMNQNKEVIFSTWGFDYAPAVDLYETRIEVEMAIKEYLVDKGDNDPIHYDGEKTFVSMRIYLLEEVKGDELYYIYAWVRDGKYYLENDELKQASGSSIPYKFVVEKINDEFEVTDSRIPRDGSYYDEDMKNIFPRSVRKDMENVYTDGTAKRLDLEVEEQAKLYFHK